MFTTCSSKQPKSTKACGASRMITKKMLTIAQSAQLFGKRWKQTKKVMSPNLRRSSRNTCKKTTDN